MRKIKIIAGITWAFICLILIVILFPGLNSFSVSTSKLPFMKLNPNYSGGVVIHQLVTENCTLNIRKPVFDGLIGERRSGFVQLDWRGVVPDNIIDTIDFDLDQNPDFLIFINRKQSIAKLTPVSNRVKDLIISTPTSYGWSVRVGLNK
jgi:hypothetical protein